jgi:glycogen debranching enzyme
MTGCVPGWELVSSPDGWPYASSASTGPGDPGRFHALFGRDSLITALQVLPARPDVARAVLIALAERQGRRSDPETLEEPGKIGHEFREHPPETFVAAGWPDEGPFGYYGTADATSWFLVLLDATGDRDLVTALGPALHAAVGWLRRTLDAGNGLLFHDPGISRGLTQQGWRDTIDPRAPTGAGILRPDGSVPAAPFADADTQAVTVAALRAATRLTGDADHARAAQALRTRIADSYLPAALAVEAGDRPVRGAGSQLGWLLWADAVVPEAVDGVVDRLARPDIATAYGLRTLASSEPTFDWHAYHRGAIWPFDSWLGWAGLRRVGRTHDAELLRRGVLGAVDRLGGFPELYLVGPDGQLAPSPLANRVQAWTVGACYALTNEWAALPP